MADPPQKKPLPLSPISELLQTLGMTRDDLSRHSAQMKQFLTAEDAGSYRAFSQDAGDVHEQGSTTSISAVRSRSNSNANASRPVETPPPPMTPVKREPTELSVPPPRRMDAMEMVIERKNKEKRARRLQKEKQRREVHRAPSPSPVQYTHSLDSAMRAPDNRRVDVAGAPYDYPSIMVRGASMVTPPHLRYYRDSFEHPLPQVARPVSPSPMPTKMAPPPMTPRGGHGYYRTSLPPSSPIPHSPPSSPQRIVNMVSSPGPMGPAPSPSEYPSLPFRLPSTPRSTNKPSYSYAALIGQAILASASHRLTLQEIYEYITIVYPYYKRGGGEQTWQNSIRHVLSTTAVFRKVDRDERDDRMRPGDKVLGKSKGRTLWAILDHDLACFKDKGFDKRHCRDMMATQAKSRKRPAEDSLTKKTRRVKKSGEVATEASAFVSGIPQPLATGFTPTLHGNAIFPPHPYATGHQPYYPVYPIGPQPLPAEVYFPPLPAYYNQIRGHPASSYASSSAAISRSSSSSYLERDTDPSPVSPPPSSTSSYSYPPVPHLTPNNSASSSSSPPLDEGDSRKSSSLAPSVFSSVGDNRRSPSIAPSAVSFGPDELDPEEAFSLLEPSITLHRQGRKGKAPAKKRTGRKASRRIPSRASDRSPPSPIFPRRASTPLLPPSTPPPRRTGSGGIQLSPVRTPLSHKGLHMSPSVGDLGHYKTNLNPPASYGEAGSGTAGPSTPGPSTDNRATSPAVNPTIDDETLHTPQKRRTGSSQIGVTFQTPRTLFFDSNGQVSPSRVFGSSISASSLFFDPVDPSAILDEELSRLGAARDSLHDSPVGLYGSGRLLYESPGVPSPSRWPRPW